MALSIKKKVPPEKQTKTSEIDNAMSNLSVRSSQHAIRADATIKELESQRQSYLDDAKECVTKTSMKYNPGLAQTYFNNAKVLEAKIGEIKRSQANSAMLVATVKADTYLTETAKFMSSVSTTQGTMIKHIDVDKAERTADRVADRREQLDAASKTINGALGSVTDGMIRNKLNDDQAAEYESHAAAADPGISGMNTDFALWAQQVQNNPASNPTSTAAVAPSAPSFQPGDRAKEKPEWEKLLDELPDRSRQAIKK